MLRSGAARAPETERALARRETPRISVVLPVLDEAARIERRLTELARFRFHEVIVVDGGSRDGTPGIVAGRKDVKLLEAPRGRAFQMNAGAREATGEILLFLHADVSLPEDAPARIRRALNRSDTVAGAFRTWTVADGPGPWWSPLLHLADLRSRYTGLPYGDQAIFVRREIFEEVGGYPELPLMEDLAFSRRVRDRGRIEIVRSRVIVSGRRFLERPIYYTLAVNLFPLLFRLGVPPGVLARLYGNPRELVGRGTP
jgi:rSAM/selenodomain-associated transferase 2